MQVKQHKYPPLPRKNTPLQLNLNVKKANKYEKYSSIDKLRNHQKKQNQSLDNNKQNQRRPQSTKSISKSSKDSYESKKSNQSSHRIQTYYQLKSKVNMPYISAKSWLVYQMNQNRLIYGRKSFKKCQMASLTKIMTLITILELLQVYNLQPSKIIIQISKDSAYIMGTTAELHPGYQLSLQQLFYGMMLPSGNDAAYQIAQIGTIILSLLNNNNDNNNNINNNNNNSNNNNNNHNNNNNNSIDKNILYNITNLTMYSNNVQNKITKYLTEMNKLSRKIGMLNTHFANPHGLSNINNYSTAQDLCKLCQYAMKQQKFRNIVSTKVYFAQYNYNEIKQQFLEKSQDCNMKLVRTVTRMNGIIKWQNTNKLLNQGWCGIKTGITPNAGPCLSACVQRKGIKGQNINLLIILLCSRNMQARWQQMRQILTWVLKQHLYR